MIKKIKEFILKYYSEIVYIFVGALTTLINFIVYFIVKDALNLHYIAANIVAWVTAVLFAYVANRIWVFRSESTNILKEFGLFVLSRLFSLMLETGLLFMAVDVLKVNDSLAKIIIAFLVIICNYITGKWIVFRREKQ
jgi:Predicted membrane protein